MDEKIPTEWPKSIGGKYKHPEKFDDSYSLYKSINEIHF